MGCGCCSCGKGDAKGKSKLLCASGGILAVVVGVAVALQTAASSHERAPASPPAKSPPLSAGTAVEKPAAPASPYVLDHTMKRIDGAEESLDKYKDKVVLIVNVASKCGYTPQYEGLEKLYKSKKDAGLVILGFPADNFRHQEPGTNEQIAEFCTSKFGVTFPMFEKISVTGPDQDPLYKQLAAQPSPIGGDPKWNFTKFLVDRDGNVVARFEPMVKPDDPSLLKQVESLLAAKP